MSSPATSAQPKSPDVESIMMRATNAAAVFSQLDQAATDRIVRAVYEAAMNHRVRLAKLAHEETGIGIWEHKVVKNVVAAQLVYESIRDEKTVGVIAEDEDRGIIEIAQPLGPIYALIPVTNPTSTVLFKVLIAMKTRNPLIIGPHPKAVRSSTEAARICYEAALRQDAPEDCIQWVPDLTREQTQALMGHPRLALVLATGGSSLVKAAYSSGTPALGVGPGNVPVFIERTADVPFAVQEIMTSKTFDNGTVCASEQAIVIEKPMLGQVTDALQAQGGYFLDDEQIRRVEPVAYDRQKRVMNAEIVGRSADTIARMAGISVPAGTRLLVARQDGVGPEYPLSSEILAPIIAFYTADDFESAVNRCIDLNFYGGMGHTVSMFSNDEARIREFSMLMNAGRIVVNTPSSQGGVGGIYNTLRPSFTLGCGTGGRNITTDNITARHLLNTQRICHRRPNERFARLGEGACLDESLDAAAIERLYHRNH